MEEKNEEVKEQKVQETVPKKNKKLRTKLVLLFLILAIIIGYIAFRGSYLETMEIGEKYINVYWNNIKYKISTFVVEFIVLFISIIIGTKGIKKGLKAFFEDEKKEMPKTPGKSIAFILSLIISALTFNPISKQVMLMFNSASFGLQDPVFKLDIGYYIFQKPFIELLIASFIFIIIGLAIYTVIYYLVAFNRFFDGIDRKTLKQSRLIKQLLRYLKLVVVGISALIIINTQNILFEKIMTLDDKNSTALYGAGMTDIFIKIAGYIILAVIVIISVFRAIRYFLQKNTKKVIKSLAIVPAYLVCLFVVLFGFQLIVVSPNELDKQKEYIENNIEATKNAYGLNISEQNINDVETISLEQIQNNQNVLDNITIVDEDITLSTLTDKQSKSQYYTYLKSKLSQYNINGTKRLVYLSARELSNVNGSNYDNKTYRYTHGFGTVITSATSVDETGNIEYIQKEFNGSDEKVNVSEPRIYYGTQTKQTVITNSNNKKEFDYPISDTENAENNYNGEGGIKLGFLDRLVLGIYKRNLKIAFTTEVSENSKILLNRNIIERVKTILPDIMYDEEPYQIITDEGKTVWVIDGYTTSSAYPYSQSTLVEVNGSKQRINYIRNSVKVIVDSYDGTVKFYITDRTDPIIMAYRNIYPNLFENIDETIPQDIASHITYSQFLYNIQAKVLERYHNVKTDVLYRSNDVWTPATHVTGKNLTTTGTEIEPYYTMVKTIDSEEELGLVLPYTLDEKQSITSYLVGTIDENGKNVLRLYKFADDSNVLGTMQLDTQIEQNSEISSQLKSLSVSGTKLIRNTIVVPIDNTLLYVEPIYQVMLNESEVPILRKIIVASGNKVAIGNNLTEAIENLTSQYATKIEITNTDDKEGLINEIIKANTNLTNSNASNNWELIGTDLKKLQELINELEETIKQEEKENKANATVESNAVDTNTVLNTNVTE